MDEYLLWKQSTKFIMFTWSFDKFNTSALKAEKLVLGYRVYGLMVPAENLISKDCELTAI